VKRTKAWKEKLPPGKQYPIDDALKLVKEFATAKFNEVGGRVGEPGRRCHQVRPAGARLDRDAARHRQDGARRRVHQGKNQDAAKAAGADIVGFEDLAEKVKAGRSISTW
jgi:large subunit ribosomal protein L1